MCRGAGEILDSKQNLLVLSTFRWDRPVLRGPCGHLPFFSGVVQWDYVTRTFQRSSLSGCSARGWRDDEDDGDYRRVESNQVFEGRCATGQFTRPAESGKMKK